MGADGSSKVPDAGTAKVAGAAGAATGAASAAGAATVVDVVGAGVASSLHAGVASPKAPTSAKIANNRFIVDISLIIPCPDLDIRRSENSLVGLVCR